MGIQGLLPLLKSITKGVHISSYANLKVAIDAHGWLHRAVYSCSTVSIPAYTEYCMNLINLLQRYDITPIVVFDGQSLPAKAITSEKRRLLREQYALKAKEADASGFHLDAAKFRKKTILISDEIVSSFIDALCEQSIDYVVSPYESDAQLAYLSLTGIADVVISEDSDVLVYGCQRVLFKLDNSGNGEEIKRCDLGSNLELSFANWTDEQFKLFCCLSGCDYVPKLRNIGIKTAHIIVSSYRTYGDIKSYLRQHRKECNDEFFNELAKGLLTFSHQTVLDPPSGRIRHLAPISAEAIHNPKSALHQLYHSLNDNSESRHYPLSGNGVIGGVVSSRATRQDGSLNGVVDLTFLGLVWNHDNSTETESEIETNGQVQAGNQVEETGDCHDTEPPPLRQLISPCNDSRRTPEIFVPSFVHQSDSPSIEPQKSPACSQSYESPSDMRGGDIKTYRQELSFKSVFNKKRKVDFDQDGTSVVGSQPSLEGGTQVSKRIKRTHSVYQGGGVYPNKYLKDHSFKALESRYKKYHGNAIDHDSKSHDDQPRLETIQHRHKRTSCYGHSNGLMDINQRSRQISSAQESGCFSVALNFLKSLGPATSIGRSSGSPRVRYGFGEEGSSHAPSFDSADSSHDAPDGMDRKAIGGYFDNVTSNRHSSATSIFYGTTSKNHDETDGPGGNAVKTHSLPPPPDTEEELLCPIAWLHQDELTLPTSSNEGNILAVKSSSISKLSCGGLLSKIPHAYNVSHAVRKMGSSPKSKDFMNFNNMRVDFEPKMKGDTAIPSVSKGLKIWGHNVFNLDPNSSSARNKGNNIPRDSGLPRTNSKFSCQHGMLQAKDEVYWDKLLSSKGRT